MPRSLAKACTVSGLAAALAMVAGGCVFNKQVVHRPAYYGPTDDLPTLVEKLNARNARLQTLRGEGSFDADLVDPKTKDHTHPPGGDVILLYRPPRDVRMVAKVLGNRAFDIGSNSQQYWLTLNQQDVMYYGSHDAAGKGNASRLPIRPDLLAEVLGVTPLAADLLAEPTPLMRFNNDEDCYMLTWQVLMRDRFAVQREVWYDRQTLLPRMVLLFDANGRIVLRAYPTDPKPVEGYDPPLTMPSTYDLFFPDSGSTFSMRLSDLERDRDGVPSDKNFVFPGERAGVSKVENLDR